MQVQKLKEKVKHLLNECSRKKKEILEEQIKELPPEQQHAVMACFSAAKRKGVRGRRYTLEWIYQCLLMRIKGPALYDQIRKKNILAVPCKLTLNNYISTMGCAYGFSDALFTLMKEKAPHIKAEERRGKFFYIFK